MASNLSEKKPTLVNLLCDLRHCLRRIDADSSFLRTEFSNLDHSQITTDKLAEIAAVLDHLNDSKDATAEVVDHLEMYLKRSRGNGSQPSA